MGLREDLDLPELTDWRILIDEDPAATGTSSSLLEAMGAVTVTLFKYCPDTQAVIEFRENGGSWFQVPASWGS